ncbi:Fc.00g078830.m01.CDS01 [Cosmosporella sp. VM-42]
MAPIVPPYPEAYNPHSWVEVNDISTVKSSNTTNPAASSSNETTTKSRPTQLEVISIFVSIVLIVLVILITARHKICNGIIAFPAMCIKGIGEALGATAFAIVKCFSRLNPAVREERRQYRQAQLDADNAERRDRFLLPNGQPPAYVSPVPEELPAYAPVLLETPIVPPPAYTARVAREPLGHIHNEARFQTFPPANQEHRDIVPRGLVQQVGTVPRSSPDRRDFVPRGLVRYAGNYNDRSPNRREFIPRGLIRYAGNYAHPI